jgi:hypothetical protein
MSYAPEVQADSTGESRGAAVSFATKQEAIAYIVSLAPRRTSLLDIREAGSRADAQGIEAVSPLTDAGVAALGPDAPKRPEPWLRLEQVSAAMARDLVQRREYPGNDRSHAAMSAQSAMSRQKAEATAGANRLFA